MTYFAPVPVSNGVWALFPVLVANLAEWGADYFADSLPALARARARAGARASGVCARRGACVRSDAPPPPPRSLARPSPPPPPRRTT